MSLSDTPWPCTREELLDYANRIGAPLEVIENLQKLEDDDMIYVSMIDIWPDLPVTDNDFGWKSDE